MLEFQEGLQPRSVNENMLNWEGDLERIGPDRETYQVHLMQNIQ